MIVRLVFISLLLIYAPNCIAEQLRYASIAGLVEQEVGRLVIPQVYKKLDMEVVIVPMPAQQAQKNARSGKYDGEIMRIWSYGDESANVVRVPTAYYQLETMAFYKANQGIQISSKEDLINYRLLKILGVKHTENITSGLDNVVDIDSTDKMMQLLEYGRADVALTNTINGIISLKRLAISDIVHLEQPLEVLNLYHYIHISHKDLVPLVDNILQAMQSSGELKALVEQAEKLVINNLL